MKTPDGGKDLRLVLLLFLIPVHVARAGAGCDTGNLHKLPLLDAPDCSAVVADGGICGALPSSCDRQRVMVLEHVCRDGTWVWPESPVFCPRWEACTYNAPNTLICDGVNEPPENTTTLPFLRQFPDHVHPGLTHITLVNYPNLVLEPAGNLELVFVNLSHNMMKELKLYSLLYDTLRVVDLSHNLITSIGPQDLPSSGRLRELYLQGNPIEFYKPTALHAAMDRCYDLSTNTAIASNSTRGAVLDVPGCTLKSRIRNNGDNNFECVEVHCLPAYQTAFSYNCSDVPQQTIPIWYRCDGIKDCPNGEDESLCGGDLKRLELPEPNPICAVAAEFIGDKYSVNRGLLVVPLTPGGQGTFDVRSFDVPLTSEEEPFISDPSSSGLFSFIEGTLVATTAESFPTTTTDPRSVKGDGNSRKSATIISVAVLGAVVLVLVAVAVIVMLRRQRKRTLLLLDALDNARPRIPQRTLTTAEERFQLQFAPLLSADAAARYETLLVSPAQLRVGDTMLGKGTFGTVFLGSLQRGAPIVHGFHAASSRPTPRDGTDEIELIAIKTTLAELSDAALTQLLLEARLHACLSHPNLIRLLAVQGTYLPVMLGLEYCSRGDLRRELRRAAKAAAATGSGTIGPDHGLGVTEQAQRDMAAQVAAGLQYLHSKLCIHRDVAARNVLLKPAHEAGGNAGCSGFVLKLADLGLSRLVCSEQNYYRSRSDDAVPIRWQCPMAVTTRVYTAKSDVYSFGVLLWEIYSGGATPFAEFAVAEVVRAVQAGARLPRPSASTPEDILAVIRACTVLEPASRPSMASVSARLNGAWALRMPVCAEPGDGSSCSAAIRQDDEDNETSL